MSLVSLTSRQQHALDPHRYLRLALHAVARRVLSDRPSTALGALVCLANSLHDRDQRLVLFAPAARIFRAMASRDAGGLRVCGERPAVHHAHETVARCRDTARELLRLGPVQLARETRPDPLAISATVQVR